MKKELKLDPPLYTIMQVLSFSLFEKIPVIEAFLKTTCPLKAMKIINS